MNTQPGVQRAQPAAQLEVQRQHQEERRLAAPEHQLRDQPGGEPAVPNSAGVEQRRAAPAGQPALLERERAPGSAGAAASDSQVHSGQPCWRPSTSGSTIAVSAGGDQRGAGEVDACAGLGARDSGITRGATAAPARRSGR